MTARSPFVPFPKGRGPAKVFVFGDPGTEKTRRALRMPGPRFFVDLECGADEYGDLAQDGDQYRACASVSEFVECLDYLESLDPAEVGTLVVDPITVIWQAMQNAHVERVVQKKEGKVSPDEVLIDQGAWSRLNRSHGDLTTRMLNAPFHVVWICRGKVVRNNDGVEKDYTYEGHKTLSYLAKTVVIAREGFDIVVKDRTGLWRSGRVPNGERLEFADLTRGAGRGRRIATPSEAAASDARNEHHPSFEGDRGWFCGQLRDIGGWKYPDVAAYSESKGRPRPSGMDNQGRRKLLSHLESDAGRADMGAFLAARAAAEVGIA